jgi:putative transposase
MPRRARLLAAGYPMHVIVRGVDRRAVFFDGNDYRFFLASLGAAAKNEGVAVHAYVLMTAE